MARWLLAAQIVIGMAAWWRPDMRSWAALAGGMLVVLVLWMLWRILLADRTLPGHPACLALLAPAVILIVHLGATGLSGKADVETALAGGLNVTMIFQLALLACGVMLTQSLLPRAAGHSIVLSLCGAAMMVAPAVMIWAVAEARTAMTLVGFAGMAVWLTGLWGLPLTPPASGDLAPRRRVLRVGCVVAAGAVAVVYAFHSPWATILAGVVTGVTMILGGLVFSRGRKLLLLAGSAVTAASLIVFHLAGLSLRLPNTDGVSWFGRGEAAFGELSGADSGLAILLGMVGWIGAGWLIVGAAACAVWLMCHARWGHSGDRGRAVIWTAGAALAGAALLAAGGLFVPAVTLSAAFTWGMLPAMLGRASRPRSGWILAAPLGLLMVMLGVARQEGLVLWAAESFDLGDGFLHGLTGLMLALPMAWLLGTRKWWLGLLAIAAAALAGGLGELLQLLLTSWRHASLDDWRAHAIGSALAVGPYLLCIGSRWCESVDAAATDSAALDASTYGAAGRQGPGS